MGYSDEEILIWLSYNGINSDKIEKLENIFKNMKDILYISRNELENLRLLNSNMIDKLLGSDIDDVLNTIYNMKKSNNIGILTTYSSNYPISLKFISDKPSVLYYKGDIGLINSNSIAIVGTRKPTLYGKWACEKFTKELTNYNLTIVSGLAYGIDTIAHKTALLNHGQTIAVLGCGINKIYPKSNKALYDDIENNGLIITEFSPDTEPFKYNFPQRNRIISGLSYGVLVIEAQKNSGSLITASHALNQGKEVFSIPGNINSLYSEGTNALIKDGAKLVQDVEDILVELENILHLEYNTKACINNVELGDTENAIYTILKDGPLHSDLIALKSGLDINIVNSTLTILEIKGVVKEIAPSTFTIC
ncbi:MAG TPA: DNA-processing protein DprA [Soehngenia sp.]|nr:DNA-processing protein DprA [Soehngenia sp.]